jgi:hypothetical protein
MLLTGIPLFKTLSEDSALPASQKIFGSLSAVRTTCHPVWMLICPRFHPSGRRAIPSGRRQTKHHPSERRGFPSEPFTVSRSFYSSFHPSGRLSSPSGRPSVIDQTSDSFQMQIWEDCLNRPDDVVSLPDALIYKARIAIHIQPSGRLSAWSSRAFNRYGNFIFHFNCTDACLSWSGRALIRNGNCGLKINRPDDNPPWFGHSKPYMEVTCSGRATVRTTVPHRPDAALKQERFSAKISEILVAQLSVWTAHVHHPDGTRIFHCSRPFEPQPINRGLGH